jgi:hypothetical protein
MLIPSLCQLARLAVDAAGPRPWCLTTTNRCATNKDAAGLGRGTCGEQFSIQPAPSLWPLLPSCLLLLLLRRCALDVMLWSSTQQNRTN